MGDWKKELDALVSETVAFARAVRSQMPNSTERIVAPAQTSDDVLEYSQEVASTVPERAPPMVEQTIELRKAGTYELGSAGA
jgi:hypothetical protein